MTAMTEQQYDRLARLLDGEAMDLTDQEKLALDEIASLEADLRGRLDTEIPDGVVSRVGRRLAHATAPAPPVRLRVWWGRRLAVAAALLLALGGAWWLGRLSQTPTPHPQDLVKQDLTDPSRGGNAQWRAEIVAALIEADRDPELEMLAAELSALEAHMVSFPGATEGPKAVDPEIDSLNHDLDAMLREDAKPFLPEI